MGTTVKGLLRGLRCISQIFESEEDKEPEMEIGFPTDVKHVAHIGCDGTSASMPTWMNEFKSPPEIQNGPSNSKEVKNPLPEVTSQSENVKTRTRRPPSSASGSPTSPPARKSSKDGNRHARRQPTGSTRSPVRSPRVSDAPKHSRDRRSVSNVCMDSPERDSSVSSKSSKQQQNCAEPESPAHEQPSIPKHSRGRKSKGLSKSSKSNDHNSSTDSIAIDQRSLN